MTKEALFIAFHQTKQVFSVEGFPRFSGFLAPLRFSFRLLTFGLCTQGFSRFKFKSNLSGLLIEHKVSFEFAMRSVADKTRQEGTFSFREDFFALLRRNRLLQNHASAPEITRLFSERVLTEKARSALHNTSAALGTRADNRQSGNILLRFGFFFLPEIKLQLFLRCQFQSRRERPSYLADKPRERPDRAIGKKFFDLFGLESPASRVFWTAKSHAGFMHAYRR